MKIKLIIKLILYVFLHVKYLIFSLLNQKLCNICDMKQLIFVAYVYIKIKFDVSNIKKFLWNIS